MPSRNANATPSSTACAMCRGVGLVSQAEQHALRVRIIVRRALARQVGQENFRIAAGLLRASASREQRAARSQAAQARGPVDAARRAQDHRHLVPVLRAPRDKRCARRLRDSADSHRSRETAPRRCRATRRHRPARTTPTPIGTGRIVAAAGDHRHARHAPGFRELGAQLAGDFVALEQRGHVRRIEAGGRQHRLGPAPLSPRPATAFRRYPTCRRPFRRSCAAAHSPWAAAPSPFAAKIFGSCRRTHSSFGAVNPGIARLPVMRVISGTAASSSAHCCGAAAVVPQDGRAQRPHVACRAAWRRAFGRTARWRARRCAPAGCKSLTALLVADHQSAGFCSDHKRVRPRDGERRAGLIDSHCPCRRPPPPSPPRCLCRFPCTYVSPASRVRTKSSIKSRDLRSQNISVYSIR